MKFARPRTAYDIIQFCRIEILVVLFSQLFFCFWKIYFAKNEDVLVVSEKGRNKLKEPDTVVG